MSKAIACHRCKGTHSGPQAFLLTCSDCRKAWHHRCHIPPVEDQELISRIQATNDNDVDNGLDGWVCRCRRKGKAKANVTDSRRVENELLPSKGTSTQPAVNSLVEPHIPAGQYVYRDALTLQSSREVSSVRPSSDVPGPSQQPTSRPLVTVEAPQQQSPKPNADIARSPHIDFHQVKPQLPRNAPSDQRVPQKHAAAAKNGSSSSRFTSPRLEARIKQEPSGHALIPDGCATAHLNGTGKRPYPIEPDRRLPAPQAIDSKSSRDRVPMSRTPSYSGRSEGNSKASLVQTATSEANTSSSAKAASHSAPKSNGVEISRSGYFAAALPNIESTALSRPSSAIPAPLDEDVDMDGLYGAPATDYENTRALPPLPDDLPSEDMDIDASPQNTARRKASSGLNRNDDAIPPTSHVLPRIPLQPYRLAPEWMHERLGDDPPVQRESATGISRRKFQASKLDRNTREGRGKIHGMFNFSLVDWAQGKS